jgi:hypothetical protein
MPNVVRLVSKPRLQRHEMKLWSSAQLERFLRETSKDRYAWRVARGAWRVRPATSGGVGAVSVRRRLRLREYPHRAGARPRSTAAGTRPESEHGEWAPHDPRSPVQVRMAATDASTRPAAHGRRHAAGGTRPAAHGGEPDARLRSGAATHARRDARSRRPALHAADLRATVPMRACRPRQPRWLVFRDGQLGAV